MKRMLAFAAALAAASSLAAQPPQSAGQQPLALVNAVAIDVRTGSLTPNTTIVLRGGRIESVGTAAPPSGVRAMDLAGRFVLPGLVDAHTHAADFAAMRRALQSGVTTVRSAGVSNYADVGFRELAKAGAIDGPDVAASGYHVRPRLADEAFLTDPAYADLMGGVTTIDALKRAVQMNLAHGVDWIKVLATERAGTPETDPRIQVYTEAEIRAVVQEAAAKNVPVQAHAHGDEGAMAAVRAGVRSIEHGTYLSDATLQAMRQRGTYLDPTFTTVIDVAEPGGDYDIPALRIRGEHMLPRLRQTIQHALRIGVKIVTGGDTGYGPNSLTRIGQEMGHFVELGMTPLQAIQSATVTAAELLRMDRTIGQLRPGYEADLIVVDGNPLENIGVVEDPLLVVSNGRVAVNRLRFSKTSSASR
jgi:imidazolonepropionase-like amidohydrolase